MSISSLLLVLILRFTPVKELQNLLLRKLLSPLAILLLEVLHVLLLTLASHLVPLRHTTGQSQILLALLKLILSLNFTQHLAGFASAQRVGGLLSLLAIQRGSLLLLLLLFLATVPVVQPLEQLLDIGTDEDVEDHGANGLGPAANAHIGKGVVEIAAEAANGFDDHAEDLVEEVGGGLGGNVAHIGLGFSHGGGVLVEVSASLFFVCWGRGRRVVAGTSTFNFPNWKNWTLSDEERHGGRKKFESGKMGVCAIKLMEG
ncbi:hypothetical protein N7513_007948 [Penicillium frequentans]|nr:hypothetical protein N7513_007948 [Penicillium glabrum]